MKLRITEILEYYDVPQLFVAIDAIETSYLCLTYDVDETGVLHCVALSISKDRLNDFITGHLELREIYLHPEMNLYDVIIEGDDVEASIRKQAATDDMLPDEGYFLNYSQRENHDMITTSREEGCTIVRLGFNNETNNHMVSTEVLTKTVQNFQSIITKVSKKLHKNQEGNDAKLYVRATIAASFDLELVSEERSNLFGRSKVSDTLEMIKPLFSDNDEDVAVCLTNFKDIQSNYKSLVKELLEGKTSFKVKWVESSVESLVSECPVTYNRINDLYALASSFEELENSEITLEGRFFMANTRNGKWGFLPENERRQKSGVCYDRTLLNGITLNEQLYRIKCILKPSRNLVTGKEYHSYVLSEISRISGLQN